MPTNIQGWVAVQFHFAADLMEFLGGSWRPATGGVWRPSLLTGICSTEAAALEAANMAVESSHHDPYVSGVVAVYIDAPVSSDDPVAEAIARNPI
jgi:hypothetical protein